MRKGCFIGFLLFTLLTTGCGKKLKINTCINDSKNKVFACSNYKKQGYQLDYQQVNNFVCVSRNDARSIYEACRHAPINIHPCIVDSISESLICDPKKVNPAIIRLIDADGWVCFSPDDTRTIFEYCAHS